MKKWRKPEHRTRGGLFLKSIKTSGQDGAISGHLSHENFGKSWQFSKQFAAGGWDVALPWIWPWYRSLLTQVTFPEETIILRRENRRHSIKSTRQNATVHTL